MLTRLPTDYVAPDGARYALFEDKSTGQVYTYDPNHELGGLHVNPATGARTLSGLGITAESAGISAAATAASFIPGVGPIVSGVIGLVGSLFGGGDPTPLSQLIDQIVNLRAKIAQAHQAMGVPDSFTIPTGFNSQDKQKWASLVEGIVEQATGKSASDVQSSNRRADYYAAIKAMQNALQDLQTQGQIQQVVHEAIAQNAPTALPTAVATLPTSVTAAQQHAHEPPVDLPSDVGFTQYPETLPTVTLLPSDFPQQTFSPTTQLVPSMQGSVAPAATDYTPWILGGGLAILAVIVLINRK